MLEGGSLSASSKVKFSRLHNAIVSQKDSSVGFVADFHPEQDNHTIAMDHQSNFLSDSCTI